MQPELTLLQFVALALPAVAILLQAVTQYHNDLGSYAIGRWTEIRLIQWSFYMLVFAGLIFSFSLLLSSDSPYVQLGIGVAGFALLMLVPATWFGLRRGRYGPSEYDSPEQELTSKLKSILKTGAPIILGSAISTILSYTSSEVIRILNSVVGEDTTTLISLVSGLFLIGAIFITSAQVVEALVSSRRQKKELQNWKGEIGVRAYDLSEKLSTENSEIHRVNELREFRSQMKLAKENWSQLKDSTPQSSDTELEEKIETIYQSLNFLLDLSDEAIEAYEAESTYITELEDTKSHLSDLEDQKADLNEDITQREQSQPELADRIEEIREEIQQLNDEVAHIEKEIRQAKATRGNIVEELMDRRENLKEEIERLIQDLSE